ncbi:MAG: hypothetical protein ACOC2L_02970, partial [Candidatus Sumerlaeota bacterium]
MLSSKPFRHFATINILLIFASLFAVPALGGVDLAPIQPDPDGQVSVPWVKDGDNAWREGEPTFNLSDGDFDARGWIAVSDQGILMSVVADDSEHVGNNKGSGTWKNNCLRVGIDGWGDASMDKPESEQIIGFGDVSINYSLTDEGPSTYVELHSAVAGFGERPDLPFSASRDEKAGTITYDVTIPWKELALEGPVFPDFGLAVYVDNRGGEDEGAVMWSSKPLGSWDDRPICGVFKPGLFKGLNIQDPAHEIAVVSITHYMLTDARNRAEAVIAWTPGTADQMLIRTRHNTETIKLPVGEGLQRRLVTIPMDGKLSMSMDLEISLRKGPDIVAADRETLRPDYISDWYAWKPKHQVDDSALDMAEWMHTPAGKHGAVKMKDDGFEFADGTPVKFWGVNIGNRTIFGRSRGDIRQFARLYRKYGVNCLRYHKMWSPITTSESMLKFDPEGIEHWDYTISEMKKEGVYCGLSMTFRPRIPKGDADMFLAYDEIMKPQRDKQGNIIKGRNGEVRRSGHTVGYRMFAKDVQDWHIQFLVNLLNHENPHTGLPLAKDPALAFVELHNEDSIFFGTTMGVLKSSPTYEKLIREMFSDWLKTKYGSDEKLFEAWGEDTRDTYEQFYSNPGSEHLDKRNIYPMTHWWWLGQGINQPDHKYARRRLLDTARFLYEVQRHFYTRFV